MGLFEAHDGFAVVSDALPLLWSGKTCDLPRPFCCLDSADHGDQPGPRLRLHPGPWLTGLGGFGEWSMGKPLFALVYTLFLALCRTSTPLFAMEIIVKFVAFRANFTPFPAVSAQGIHGLHQATCGTQSILSATDSMPDFARWSTDGVLPSFCSSGQHGHLPHQACASFQCDLGITNDYKLIGLDLILVGP